MKKINDICVIIQARLGSQRVPKKMIKPIGDSCLFDISLKNIKKCKSFPEDNFYVSVWEPELKSIAQEHNVNVFNRSENSAKSEGTPMTAMYEWWDKLPYKYCILVSACAPFLESETIDQFVEYYKKCDSDGLFGVIKKKNYFWNSEKEILTPLTESVMNTKTVNSTFEAAHCLYAGRLDKIGQEIWMGDFRTPGDIELFEVPERESFDVDYQWQFDMVKNILEKGNTI